MHKKKLTLGTFEFTPRSPVSFKETGGNEAVPPTSEQDMIKLLTSFSDNPESQNHSMEQLPEILEEVSDEMLISVWRKLWKGATKEFCMFHNTNPQVFSRWLGGKRDNLKDRSKSRDVVKNFILGLVGEGRITLHEKTVPLRATQIADKICALTLIPEAFILIDGNQRPTEMGWILKYYAFGNWKIHIIFTCDDEQRYVHELEGRPWITTVCSVSHYKDAASCSIVLQLSDLVKIPSIKEIFIVGPGLFAHNAIKELGDVACRVRMSYLDFKKIDTPYLKNFHSHMYRMLYCLYWPEDVDSFAKRYDISVDNLKLWLDEKFEGLSILSAVQKWYSELSGLPFLSLYEPEPGHIKVMYCRYDKECRQPVYQDGLCIIHAS